MKPLLWGLLLAGMMLVLVSELTFTDEIKMKPVRIAVTDDTKIKTDTEEDTVTPTSESDNEAIEARITDALLRNPYVDKNQIRVAVVDGVVTLSGTVNTYFEKGQAEDIAASVPGVVIINNNLRVENKQSIP